MAITEAFDPATPLGSDDPKAGDDKFRSLQKVIYEWMRNGGHVAPTSGPNTDTTNGRHACGMENTSGGAGTPLVGEFYIYAADKTTRIVTIGDSTAAAPSRINAPTLDLVVDDITADSIAVSGTGTISATGAITGVNVSSGDTPGHTHTGTIVLSVPAATTGRVQGVIFENRGVSNITLLGAKLVAFTAPSGSALDVDINILAAAYTDPTAAGTSILATHPTIAAGSKVGTEITAFNDATLEPGEAWVLDVDALNSAADIVLILKIRKS